VIQPAAPVGLQPRWPLAVVLWEDSYNGDHVWFRASDIPEAIGGNLLLTTGWLIQQQVDRLTLVMLTDLSDDPQLCDTFTIPRGCIRSMSILALPPEMVAKVPDAC
jgi:hypothetical protein